MKKNQNKEETKENRKLTVKGTRKEKINAKYLES